LTVIPSHSRSLTSDTKNKSGLIVGTPRKRHDFAALSCEEGLTGRRSPPLDAQMDLDILATKASCLVFPEQSQ
jgi:hypothetical protein